MPLPLPGADDESQAHAFLVQQFGTLNTKATRPGIGDQEFSWLENFMPIGDANLRTIYGESDAVWTAPEGTTIVSYFPYNLGETSYLAVFLSDGTGYQVNSATGAETAISATPGKFYAGADLPDCAQWQSKYLIISSTVTDNDYWLWDGTALFGSGALSPDITVTNSGSDYTSAPTVTAYGGSGSGATFSAEVANGAVTQVDVVNPGSGYQISDQVILAFSGGGSDDGAAVTPTVTTSSGGVSRIAVLEGGTGHTTATLIVITGDGTGAEAVITGLVNGVITEITVTQPGTGYTTASAAGNGVGIDEVLEVQLTRGQITGFTIDTGGAGYTGAPTVTIDGDGSGATAIATVTGGAVASLTVTNPGVGYTYARVTLAGGNNAAQATISLMPFGVSGTSVETYQSRVWVANGTKGLFTAPGSTSVFATSAGGGAFPQTDSFLRRQITAFVQANGFLYPFGDSSINVISNVLTQGLPPTTTFNNSNVDPQTGTAWRDSIAALGRALVFANPTGVYALFGGAAEKVSSPLDGLFANASFNTGEEGVTPIAATTTIFGIKVYCLLFTTTDPYTQTKRNIIAVWDGQKWFIATQNRVMTLLATQEIDSELTAWGSDGAALYRLFEQPSEELQKIFQTKLRADPSYIIVKQVNRMYLMAQGNAATPPTFTVSIDTERGAGIAVTNLIAGGALTFVGTGPISFVGAGPIVFRPSGLGIYGYADQNYGRLIGFTGTTYSEDTTLLSVTGLWREFAPDA